MDLNVRLVVHVRLLKFLKWLHVAFLDKVTMDSDVGRFQINITNASCCSQESLDLGRNGMGPTYCLIWACYDLLIFWKLILQGFLLIGIWAVMSSADANMLVLELLFRLWVTNRVLELGQVAHNSVGCLIWFSKNYCLRVPRISNIDLVIVYQSDQSCWTLICCLRISSVECYTDHLLPLFFDLSEWSIDCCTYLIFIFSAL